jgi:hypothetical protein
MSCALPRCAEVRRFLYNPQISGFIMDRCPQWYCLMAVLVYMHVIILALWLDQAIEEGIVLAVGCGVFERLCKLL